MGHKITPKLSDATVMVFFLGSAFGRWSCPRADIRPVTNSVDGLAVLLYSHHVRPVESVLTPVIEALTEEA